MSTRTAAPGRTWLIRFSSREQGVSIGRSGRLSEATAVVLEQLGVAAAIESLADGVEVPDLEIRTKIFLAFEEGRAAERLPGDLEKSIYRIVEEGVLNAVREADASCVLVELVEDDHREEIKIEVSALPGERVRVSAVLPSGRGGRSMLSID
jgi:signal transduction histidine kinase